MKKYFSFLNIFSRDRLAFNFKPYRDWFFLFSVFLVFLVLIVVVHLGIYWRIKSLEVVDAEVSSLKSIDDLRLQEAIRVIDEVEQVNQVN